MPMQPIWLRISSAIWRLLPLNPRKAINRDNFVPENFLSTLFDLTGKVAIVTGGTGVLGSAMVRGLAQAGAKVGVMGRREAQANAVVAGISALGGEGGARPAAVLDMEQLKQARDKVMKAW